MNSQIDIFKSILNQDVYSSDVSYCLISNEPLVKNYITLECGHSFNYESIYQEVYQQQVSKVMDNKYLKSNEIKCPYCRYITPYSLPYHKYYNMDRYMSIKKMQRFSILNSPKYIGDINVCKYCVNNLNCQEYGCVEFNDVNKCYCNKHNQYTQNDNIILTDLSTNLDYISLSKLTCKDLVHKLRQNNCKTTGKKNQLILRIIIEKSKNVNWLDTP